ncbi:hypothetical protein BC835DRAFT_1337263 [Cytidiella melzeri]|nr:hypothetical protein BC835DRAFT_1337263 [Cytidiella melzeri]
MHFSTSLTLFAAFVTAIFHTVTVSAMPYPTPFNNANNLEGQSTDNDMALHSSVPPATLNLKRSLHMYNQAYDADPGLQHKACGGLGTQSSEGMAEAVKWKIPKRGQQAPPTVSVPLTKGNQSEEDKPNGNTLNRIGGAIVRPLRALSNAIAGPSRQTPTTPIISAEHPGKGKKEKEKEMEMEKEENQKRPGENDPPPAYDDVDAASAPAYSHLDPLDKGKKPEGKKRE